MPDKPANRPVGRGLRAKPKPGGTQRQPVGNQRPPKPASGLTSDPVMTVPDTGRIPAGWRVIAGREFAEYLLSVRFLVLIVLLGLLSALVVFTLTGNIRDAAGNLSGQRFADGQAFPPFLILFTLSPGQANASLQAIPSFAGIIVSYLGPLLGLAFGFDAISNERSEGTLPRLVSQPIHRDDVINGKFVASLAIVALMLGAVMLIVSGIGIFRLGVLPVGDVGLRLLAWYVLAILYVGFWLSLATLCSVIFKRGATAVLVVLGVWLVVAFFGGQIATIIANFVSPADTSSTTAQQLANVNMQLTIARIFPPGMFSDTTSVILNPAVNSLNASLSDPTGRAVGGLLPIVQSVLLVWPYIVALIAMMVACFAMAYVVFMRQEIRA